MISNNRYMRRAMYPFLFMVVIAAWPGFLAAADKPTPDDPEPRWWKGNLHTHTLWSDGDDFPEMVAEWYRSHGYDFLALSDHNILSAGRKWVNAKRVERRSGDEAMKEYVDRFGEHWVETRERGGNLQVRLKPLNEVRALMDERGEFLMIQSEEITDRFRKWPIHVNATNVAERIEPRGGGSVREVIQNNIEAVDEQAERTGRAILPHANHPNFRWAVTAEDLARAPAERFFEVYNGHPGVHQHGDEHHPGVERLWDIANTIRLGEMDAPPLLGLATDDSHHYHGGDVKPGRGWVMVHARRLTPESLIEAMRRGDFYASTGVTLRSVRYDADSHSLSIEIEPDGDATYTTRFIGAPAGYDDSSEPRVDESGEPIPHITRRYSDDVGKTFATADGSHPSYQLTGEELYVRAVVTSSKPHDRPSYKGQHRKAWTQPVGWRRDR